MALPPISQINTIPTNGEEWAADGYQCLSETQAAVASIEAFRVALEAGYEGEGIGGTYSFAFEDNSSNASGTAVTGNWFQVGKFVWVSIRDVFNIDTAGMNAGEQLRAPLPFTQVTNFRGGGYANFQNLASMPGAGSQLVARPTQNGDFALIANIGGTGSSGYLTVADVNSGVSDCLDLSFGYVRA